MKTNIFSVYKIQFILALKQLKEYKIDFFMGFLVNVSLTITYLFFYYFFNDLSNGILDWNFYDFILFFFMGFFSSLFLRFFWVRMLVFILKRGKLNTILSKPVNPFFFLVLHEIRGSFIPFTFILFIITLSLIFISQDYSNFLFAFLIVLIGFLIQVLFLNVIFSMAFFTKGLVNYLFEIYYRNLNSTVETYTPKFFENTKIVELVYLFPVAFIDYFFIEILKGRTTEVFVYLPNFLFFGLICFIILLIEWHYGLKKYEAFG